MNIENNLIKKVFNRLSRGNSMNKDDTKCKRKEEQIGKRRVRFCNDVSVLEYVRIVVPNNEIWYSPEDVKQFQTEICDFVKSLRKQKVYDSYNNESLELLFTTTYTTSPSNDKHHPNKQTKSGSNNSNVFSIRGIEYLIDDKILRMKNNRIDQGILAVLSEQKKQQQQQQRKSKKRLQSMMKSNKIVFVLDCNAISACYIKNGCSVECQKEGNERGMQNVLDTMSMNNKIVPHLSKLTGRSASTPAARNIVAQRNRRATTRAMTLQKY